jgi:hypothetical protein
MTAPNQVPSLWFWLSRLQWKMYVQNTSEDQWNNETDGVSTMHGLESMAVLESRPRGILK